MHSLGVGKSKTIEAMSCWAEKILTKVGDNPNKPRVIIAAATGKAASIVSKLILNNACTTIKN